MSEMVAGGATESINEISYWTIPLICRRERRLIDSTEIRRYHVSFRDFRPIAERTLNS
jgi:hypothetical protein